MCTLEKQGNIFILTLTGPGEHRLNPTLIDEIRSALGRVRAESTTSSALITTAEGKFFSNGLDLQWLQSSPDRQARTHQLGSKFRSLIADLISLPMPTIAAVTGHASAAGIGLALCYDYVLMRKDRGFLYMSELDIGMRIPAWFVAIIRCKVGAPAARRLLLLAAGKLTATEAVEKGIVDSEHIGAEATVEAAVGLAEKLVAKKWDGEVYAQIRMELFSEILGEIRANSTGSRL
uniref:Delta(3)-Delta(2)-enoyl-CoA isomerase n=1 Tax=Morus alba var. multicaulis TaxID=170012 RepID=A0A0A0QZ10_MORAL|nr:enoyl-CoA hydratase [Morus alba var. multicaulis]